MSSGTANPCFALGITQWNAALDAATKAEAVAALEGGKVLTLPQLAFGLSDEEKSYLRPDCVDSNTKSIKFSLARQKLWGVAKKEKETRVLENMLRRYAEESRNLVTQLFPGYAGKLIIGNTSFRPVEAQGRVQSKRHDDRLLHVDAFPSRPSGGERLLRVFSNVHPDKGARVWRVGESFEDVAKRFLPKIAPLRPLMAKLLKFLKITKTLRTPYDHYMLHLHDGMKLSDDYQAQVSHSTVAFPAGSSWIVFSDQVSHAAMSGQFAFEQTFTLPIAAQADPATSPLHVLEKLTTSRLV